MNKYNKKKVVQKKTQTTVSQNIWRLLYKIKKQNKKKSQLIKYKKLHDDFSANTEQAVLPDHL